MKELVDALVKELKVDERQAAGGAAVLFKAARDKLGAGEFSRLLGPLPGLDALLARAPSSGGLGKLFGGIASAVGASNAALIANIVADFGKLGLSQQHAQQFVPVILQFLRGKIGREATETLEKSLRA
ncbi:MAG: DUF2780 domain-containing protein [Steroidobacteraceae bacterium]|nr:DUF2780 domain-containing protein [Steroidobacteraceae bacterium]MDW8260351.1 DUF2780 domain-containing protein [Gammaproteobacteria bacterium]